MNYEFPRGLTLDEVRSVVRAHNAANGADLIIEGERGYYSVFQYLIITPNTFPTPVPGTPDYRKHAILRECRGLKFYPDGRVAARPFHKFFNVNEKPETQAGAIDWASPHAVLDKLDGSMTHPLLRPDGVIEWHTKMGLTEASAPINAFVATQPGIAALAAEVIDQGRTPLFEFCSRKNRIVINYGPADQMTLIAVRDNETGLYADIEEMQALCTRHGVACVALGHAGAVTDVSAFLAAVRALKDAEGFVICFADGHRCKVKAEAYMSMHRSKEACNSERDILNMIFSDTIDDLKPLLSEEDRACVDRFEQAFEDGIEAAGRGFRAIVEAARPAYPTKKAFAEYVRTLKRPAEAAHLFSIYDGHHPRHSIVKHCLLHLGSGPRIEMVRHLWGGLRWEAFRDAPVAE